MNGGGRKKQKEPTQSVAPDDGGGRTKQKEPTQSGGRKKQKKPTQSVASDASLGTEEESAEEGMGTTDGYRSEWCLVLALFRLITLLTLSSVSRRRCSFKGNAILL